VENLTLFCGGCSTEHDITFLSAQNVINSIDSSRYAVTVIYISPTKGWFRLSAPGSWERLLGGESCDNREYFEPVAVAFDDSQYPWVSLQHADTRYPADVVFPVLHGTEGEDGCIQGVLTMLGLPFVGADTLASAVLMNKVRTKQVLEWAGVPCAPFKAWAQSPECLAEAHACFHAYGGNVFVKAASLGSSVGVYQVQDEAKLEAVLAEAFRYDEWVMMEPAIAGREIEVAVLGNRGEWQVAGPGEIVKKDGFYSFDAKYHDPDAAAPLANADVTDEERENIFSVAKAAAMALDCEGMCRVDGFLTEIGFVINEINTIPGFTNISLYPGMWKQAGKSTQNLISDLLQLACKRKDRLSALQRSYSKTGVAL
jgi:D-alanine-D-alanine ligase